MGKQVHPEKDGGRSGGTNLSFGQESLTAGATKAPWLGDAEAGLAPRPAPVSVRVLEDLDRYRGSNAKATLVFPNRTRYGRVHLFGLDTLRSGRVPERNDVGLLVLPLTPENHSLSMAISSQHFLVQLTPNGIELHDTSKYGTSLNGQSVQGTAMIPLDQVSEVSVAVSLRLRLTPLTNQPPVSGRAVDPYLALGPTDDLWNTAAGLALGGLFIERAENLADMESYLMIFTWAALGPAFDGEAGGPAMEGGRLRLVRRQGQFWLHNVAAVRSATVAGTALPVGFASPLMPGLTLGIGKETVEFTEFQQFGMDGV